MGIDLRVLPQNYANADTSATAIDIDRDYDFFDILRKLSKVSSFAYVWGYTPHGYQKIYEDAYGDPISGIRVHILKKALKKYKTDNWLTQAFRAYVNEMPDDLLVWLYWC